MSITQNSAQSTEALGLDSNRGDLHDACTNACGSGQKLDLYPSKEECSLEIGPWQEAGVAKLRFQLVAPSISMRWLRK